MPPVAEHHVADDQQAPFVADHFEREIDRAAGALVVGHVMRSLPPCGVETSEARCPGLGKMPVTKVTAGSINLHRSREGKKNRLQYRTSCLKLQPVAKCKWLRRQA